MVLQPRAHYSPFRSTIFIGTSSSKLEPKAPENTNGRNLNQACAFQISLDILKSIKWVPGLRESCLGECARKHSKPSIMLYDSIGFACSNAGVRLKMVCRGLDKDAYHSKDFGNRGIRASTKFD